MKVTITDEEVKFLANMICKVDQPTAIRAMPDEDWMNWVAVPIAQHAINPREAKATLTVVGILTDYEIPVNTIMETLLKEFVTNYQNNHTPKDKITMRQNYSCNVCGLKSFVLYDSKEDAFDVVTKIEKDHKEKEPTCSYSVDSTNAVGEPIEV